MGLLVAYQDYGFTFKMKMTEVGNPLQRKQKRLGMSSNSSDVKTHNAIQAVICEMQCLVPGDNMV